MACELKLSVSAPVAGAEGVELTAPLLAGAAEATAATAATAAAEGVEMAAIGAVAAEEATIGEAVAAGAAAGALSTSELGPLAIGGAAIGAGIGLVTGIIAATQPKEDEYTPHPFHAPGNTQAARIAAQAAERQREHDEMMQRSPDTKEAPALPGDASWFGDRETEITTEPNKGG